MSRIGRCAVRGELLDAGVRAAIDGNPRHRLGSRADPRHQLRQPSEFVRDELGEARLGRSEPARRRRSRRDRVQGAARSAALRPRHQGRRRPQLPLDRRQGERGRSLGKSTGSAPRRRDHARSFGRAAARASAHRFRAKGEGLSQLVVLAAVSRNPRRSGRIGAYWRGHQRPRARRSIASSSTVGAPPLRRHSMPIHLLFHVASSRSSNTTPR